jgi:hypothetical protein
MRMMAQLQFFEGTGNENDVIVKILYFVSKQPLLSQPKWWVFDMNQRQISNWYDIIYFGQMLGAKEMEPQKLKGMQLWI